ncbi:MAG: sigma-54 dependent transcriptional regulator [Syntrophales bacterium]|nr:sigma-54 dependent transcriptional regulator [Syntrophales bacterium]MDD5231802.1 sigma-54 dependent transcriptional regulator [Syntrophales bacterium]MDD5531216.1 sigma-54 dependent transcriptional regulator [Syntrophales bacterium]
MKPILIVDDEPSMRMALSESLVCCGYEVDTASDGTDALRKIGRSRYELVITDMRMPGASGMEVLRGVKNNSPETRVIVITAYGTVNTAVEAMKEGASDFIMKPFSLEDLELVVKNVITGVQPEPERETGEAVAVKEIITRDKQMLSLLETLKAVSRSKSTVLIQGESGTGKELVARFVHRHSNRSRMPFVAINCAAVPHNLLESEMFGYEKGAFTGAAQRRVGKFELADGGTLLLDEISEMDIQLQAKLLRAIQESEIDRLGGKGPVAVDVRIIATTNADLKKEIQEKRFREDLYYRLNVIPVRIPPLRERISDVGPLAEFFLDKHSRVNQRKKPALKEEVLERMKGYHWPGNVRELENAIERAVLMCAGGEINPDLPFSEEGGPQPEETGGGRESGEEASAAGTLRDMEKRLICDTLRQVQGNKTQASKILGISVRTMRNKLNEYRME